MAGFGFVNQIADSVAKAAAAAASAASAAAAGSQPSTGAPAGSNISASNYNYDFVVAVTQKGVNAALMKLLARSQQPRISMCYVADQSGQPQAIALSQLLARSNGTDPFTIPRGTEYQNPAVQNLVRARFLAGFSAQLGQPLVAQGTVLPPMVVLGSQTSAVTFNMLWSNFTVAQLTVGQQTGQPSWFSESQQPDAPWIMTTKVDLRLSSVNQPVASATLSPVVRQQVMNFSASAFGAEQLLFDLTNTALMRVPTIGGLSPSSPVYTLLTQYFATLYYNQMKAQSQSLFAATFHVPGTSDATVQLGSFNFNVNPYMDSNGQPIAQPTADQQQLATLNYLCAAQSNGLAPASNLNWNWVDASQLNDRDGTIAMNRNAFVTYIRQILEPYAGRNCMQPSCRVWLSGAFDTNVHYSVNFAGNQKPTVTVPPTGKTVLKYTYESWSRDTAGLNGDMGELKVQVNYDLTVDFQGNTIVTTQHSVVYMDARKMQTSGSGNIIDKTVVDTYTLNIDPTGKLAPSGDNSSVHDISNSPSVNSALNFFTDFNSLSNTIRDFVRTATPNLQPGLLVPLITRYVFPGSQTFTFKNVTFSNNQDLVSLVSYA